MERHSGSMIDMFFVVIVILFLGIVIVLGVYLKDQIFPQLTDFFGTGDATDVVNTASQGYRSMDYIFLFLFFGLCSVPIILAMMVNINPVFYVINIIVIIFFFIITPQISNIMQQFWGQDEFAVYASGGSGSFTFPIMTRVFQYMPFITCGISLLLMIIMFVKRGSEI
jgi:hypothetical protein